MLWHCASQLARFATTTGHAKPLLARLPAVHFTLQAAAAKAFSRSFASSMVQRPAFGGGSARHSIAGPVLFCTGTSLAVYAAAAAYERRAELRQQKNLWQAYVARKREPRPTWLSYLPEGAIQENAARAVNAWNDLPGGDRVMYTITALNTLVLIGWRIRPLQKFMYRNFIHALPPQQGRLWTLLTANFSHQTPMHLAFNTLALISFGKAVTRDSQHGFSGSHFAAFYVTGGLASSLMSHLGRIRTKPGGFSLGSSGAVFAVVAAVAVLHPHSKAQLIFLPGVNVDLQTLLPCLMAVDAAGILLGWRFLDHWGHLGGALFGYLYVRYAKDIVWQRTKELAPLQATSP